MHLRSSLADRHGGSARCRLAVLIVLLALQPNCLAGTAHAETLADALVTAHARHPALMAELARKRAAEAGVDIARSGYYPRLTATGDVGTASGGRGLAAGSPLATSTGTANGIGEGWSGRWAYALSAEQPLFDGYRTRNAIAEARSQVDAARGQVTATLQTVLLETVAAYASVLRDREVISLRQRDISTVDAFVGAAVARAERGAGTATEVSQARARQALATADLIEAKANATASAADYERILGRAPGALQHPDLPHHVLPGSLDTALATADAANPSTQIATAKHAAARHAVDRIGADGLPQVKLRAGIDGERGFDTGAGSRDGASVGVRVSVPLFDGGEAAARIRQARELSVGLAHEVSDARARVRSGVVAAWGRLKAARERLAAEKRSVAQSRRALDSIREEIELGQRSTLEGLDAQRELVIAEVRVAASRRDLVVGAYALLAAIGRLDADVARAAPDKARTTTTRKASAAGPPAHQAWQTRVQLGR